MKLNARKLNTAEVTKLHLKYLNPYSTWIIRFTGTHRQFRKAKGIYLVDEKGRRYLDFLSGFGALNLGHEPPEVLKALKEVEGCPNILQVSLNPFAAKLAELLAKVTPGNLSRTFFCNSGTEAVEAAIKLCRCASGRKILLSTQGAFHGKTMGALSVSGKDKYKTPFEPLLPAVKTIPYNNLAALKKALRQQNVAGFIVEPIQGEAGVIVPDDGYLKSAAELCRKYGTLLIIDEVQSGMGRTGKLFCCEYEKVQPDILCLSKSLGGGVMPIGAMITTDKIWRKAYGSLETCLLHSSTFGGNSRACACGIAALNAIMSGGLIRNAKIQGDYLIAGLKSLQKRFSVIREVRGRGLMVGIHFARLKGKSPLVEGALTLLVVRQLFRKHRIVTAFTLNNYDVLRIMPPLNVTPRQIEEFLDALEDVLKTTRIFSKFRLIKATE
jgi:putrescine aminotransferase